MHCHVCRKSGHARRSRYFSPSGGDRSGIRVQVVVREGGLRLRMSGLFARLVLVLLGQISDLVAENPTDRADGGQIEFITHTVRKQSVSNLPSENARVPLLVSPNVLDYGWGRDPRFTAANSAGKY